MKFHRRKILSMLSALLAGTLCLPGAIAHAEAPKSEEAAALLPAKVRDASVLRIAVPDTGKPLAYQDAGTWAGMDVDLANAVAATLGLRPEISYIPFSAALTGLQANRYDISFGEFYVTAERLKVADFVINWQDYSSFLVDKNAGYEPTELEHICGKAVGAMAGSAELEILKTGAEKCEGEAPTVNAFPSISNAILALSSRRVDGVLINRGGAQEAINLNDSLVASGELGGGPTATAVARNENSKEMTAAIKAAYDSLIKSGEYLKILEKNDTAYGAVESATIYTEDTPPPSYDF